MRNLGLLVAGVVLLAGGLAGLGGLGLGLLGPGPLSVEAARGEWIFQTGTDPDTGEPIPYSGGMPMVMGCAGCHGPDGRGLRTPMFISPDITYRNLTDPGGMVEPDGSRGPRYTDELIRRAITVGVDAEGRPLAWPMPRWRLTDRQWQELLAYLKSLP